MLPWPPNTRYSRFAHERTLSDDEIHLITGWVEKGTLRGDSTQAPPYPTYPRGTVLGQLDEQYTIPRYPITSNRDVYKCFVIPAGNNMPRYISQYDG
jgi:hypothetical protein